MSLAKVIEVIAEGETIEKAMENAASQASKTVKNIKSINCENIQALVENNYVKKYRVNAKVTFVLENWLLINKSSSFQDFSICGIS